MGAAACAVVALLLGGCGSAAPTGHSAAVEVVTDDWALGRVAGTVGGGHLAVVQVAPGAPPPHDPGALWLISSASSAAYRTAASEAAASLDFGGNELVPADLTDFAARLAATLSRLVPTEAGAWRDGRLAVQTQMQAVADDAAGSLQACSRRSLVAGGPQLDGLAHLGDLTTVVVTAATPPGQAQAAVRAAGSAVFDVSGAPDTALRSAAAAVGAKVVTVPALIASPPGARASTTYAGALESDLTSLLGGLGCPLEQ
ncbi:MAG TPA: hypothetical protein VFP61_10215 [Acidimicrobiales bacterium]|nr:hypothetical protein [Acidimicrobiales bacterium]